VKDAGFFRDRIDAASSSRALFRLFSVSAEIIPATSEFEIKCPGT